MKLFKKLMAVALAGVMALTILTGCGASFDKKEMIAMLNDYTGGMVEIKDAGSKEARTVISLVQKAYDETKAEDKAAFDPLVALFGEKWEDTKADATKDGVKKVNEALGITNTEDNYTVAITEMKTYNSQLYQNHETSKLLADAMNHSVMLTDADTKGNRGTVSMDAVKLGDKEYLVMVIMVIA